MSSALRSIARYASHRADGQRDVEGMARYRIRRGHQIADRLEAAARACGSSVALAVADRMRECCSPQNIQIGRDIHNDEGECFDAPLTLWACGSRLCPSCSSTLSRRARRSARSALARVIPKVGQRWRFISLTAPTLPADEVSLLLALKIKQRAWSLFRKRKWFKTTVRAGIKGAEFTLGNPTGYDDVEREWDSEIDGYHDHIHFMALTTDFIDWHRLRALWTDCVETAWRENGIDAMINTSDGYAVVDVRQVVNRKTYAGDKRFISHEAALQEVCKYVTKSESWLSVPDSQLVSIAEVKRWPRMFELIGEARESSHSVTVHSEANKTEAVTYLDTQDISDGEASKDSLVSYLDCPVDRPPPTWRELAVTLERQAWLNNLRFKVGVGRRWRKSMLTHRYPHAEFEPLWTHGGLPGERVSQVNYGSPLAV